jgi:hypothetical protein
VLLLIVVLGAAAAAVSFVRTKDGWAAGATIACVVAALVIAGNIKL